MYELLTFLLKHIDISNPDTPYDRSVIYLASEYSQLEVIRILLASKLCYYQDVGCALVVATQYGLTEVVKTILSTDIYRESYNIPCANYASRALRLASESGELEIARLLIKSGCDINAVDTTSYYYQDDTALRRAVYANHFAIARLLIENGANVDDGLERHCKRNNIPLK